MFARILRWCEMSWDARTQLKVWLQKSKTFSSFDMDNFSSPSLRVACATDSQGAAICYCPIEQILMVRSFAVNPKATEAEATMAGNQLDQQIERLAQMNNISKLLLVLPKDHPALQDDEWGDFKECKIYERKIPPAIGFNGVGCPTPSPAQYIN